MIYWIATRGHAYTLEKHLAHFGRMLVGNVSVQDYRFLHQSNLPVGTYILADIERLSETEIARYDNIVGGLVANGSVVLNRPGKVKRRYELLTGLANQGMNEFRVFREAEVDNCKTFPVFLRCENDHNGSLSGLLRSREELQRAIEQQSRTRMLFHDEQRVWRWFRSGPKRKQQLLVTEFCDTSDCDGVFRKYSAFIVDGTVIPRHLFFGKSWMLKAPELKSRQQLLAEELEYVRCNPHAMQLKQIFGFANIDYGRIDYGLKNSRVQTWEINTNPMITTPDDARGIDRLAVQEMFVAKFHAALQSALRCQSSAVAA